MIIDGLVDVYNKYHMGVTAENVAEISNYKEQQDILQQILKQLKQLKIINLKMKLFQFKLKMKIFDTDEYPKKILQLKFWLH